MQPPLPGRGECTAQRGYLRVCTEWTARFWLEDNEPLLKLNSTTAKFDGCGAQDKNGDPIEKGS